MATDSSLLEVPTYIAKRVNLDFSIDGVWSKWPWAAQQVVGPFRHFNGRDCVQRTYARMCWNIKYFYVVFLCTDDDIWGGYRQHDDPIYEEDVVEVFIAPHGIVDGEPTVYYEVEVSPHNVTFDVKVTNATGFREGCAPDRGGALDRAWTCAGLRTAVQVKGTLDDLNVRDDWWSCEIAIPWTSMGVAHPNPHNELPINLYRIDRDRRKNRGGDEYQCWSPTLSAQPDNHVPGRFGVVGFA